MDVIERLRDAVLPVVAVCVPDLYDGDAVEYCTFTVDESPEDFGDNAPNQMRHLVQLHYYLPPAGEKDPRTTKRALCRAIFGAGFTYPEVTNASDETGQHFVFEFEDVDGDL